MGSIADQHRLTYAMFADATTFIAKSRRVLTEMLHDFVTVMSELGLSLNVDKCAIQCLQPSAMPKPPIRVQDMDFMVVDRDVGFKVLGTTFTLDGSITKAFESRLAAR